MSITSTIVTSGHCSQQLRDAKWRYPSATGLYAPDNIQDSGPLEPIGSFAAQAVKLDMPVHVERSMAPSKGRLLMHIRNGYEIIYNLLWMAITCIKHIKKLIKVI